MKYVIMNMVRIYNDGKVVVLDKKKKHGWEGLTFPGGKVEPFESFYKAAVREVKEETNLDISDLEYNGVIQWIDYDNEETQVGLIYTARKCSGQLVEENREGKLFYEDYEVFKKMDGHSDSMEYIFKILDGHVSEIVNHYKDGKLVKSEEFK